MKTVGRPRIIPIHHRHSGPGFRQLLAILAVGAITACSHDSATDSGMDSAVDSAMDSTADRAAMDAASALPVKGYVLTDFRFVTPGAGANDCPNGFNLGVSDRFLNSLSAAERKRYESDRSLLHEKIGPYYYDDPKRDPCANPSAFEDPGMYTIDGSLAIERMEPDGSISSRSLPPASCPTSGEFYATVNQRTLDNQHWRLMGCVKTYQPGGLAETFSDLQVKEGNMTVLLEVRGPAEGADGMVEVGIYSSLEPVPLDANGNPAPNASLQVAEDTRFHNRVRGEIKDGVLTSEPFDLRLVYRAQRIDSELYLRNARLRLEPQPGGGATGYIGGYWDIESLADSSIRMQDRTGRSSGYAAADVHGYTCPGKYYALKRLADGHPDPETGDCTSISTLYHLEAIPAFVLSR